MVGPWTAGYPDIHILLLWNPGPEFSAPQSRGSPSLGFAPARGAELEVAHRAIPQRAPSHSLRPQSSPGLQGPSQQIMNATISSAALATSFPQVQPRRGHAFVVQGASMAGL